MKRRDFIITLVGGSTITFAGGGAGEEKYESTWPNVFGGQHDVPMTEAEFDALYLKIRGPVQRPCPSKVGKTSGSIAALFGSSA